MDRGRLPRLTFSVLLSVLVAFSLVAINEAGFRRSSQALAAIDEATHARSTLNRLLRLMLEAEAGLRGYLLTGETRYLPPYEAAAGEVERTLEALARDYPEPGPEAARVAALAADTRTQFAGMAQAVRRHQQGQADAGGFAPMADAGDALRARVLALVDQASARVQDNQAQVRWSLLLGRLGVAAVTLVALAAFCLYLRQWRLLEEAGEREQRALQHERDQLEQLVRERTASLAELATHLQQVREQERGHLARELHDELGALLTAAKLDVARLKSRVGSASPEVAQRLAHLVDTLNRGIALKRRIIENLRPSALANLGLAASLEILAREFSEQSGVAVTTRLEPVQLDEACDLTAYRLVQESLTNVAKYAQARRVEISVEGSGALAEVCVRDDGIGFDPAAVRPSTHGLAGMRHRVEAAGGRLAVTSAPGQGTRVVALLPQHASPEEPRQPVAP